MKLAASVPHSSVNKVHETVHLEVLGVVVLLHYLYLLFLYLSLQILFCVVCFISLNKIKIFQFFIIYFQIRLMFLCITQNVTFSLSVSIFVCPVSLHSDSFLVCIAMRNCRSRFFNLFLSW